MRILAVLIAVCALLFVFRGYYLESLRDRPRLILEAAAAVAAVVVLVRVGQHYQWTGFGESVQARKTLWDWLQLFIVPLALAAIGLWFSAQQDARQRQIEAERAENNIQIEEQRAQDAALQAYLDQMSQLMLAEGLRESEEGSAVSTLARARTQTVIGRLDSGRQGSVVQFLYEASLIDKERPVVSLSAVRLSGVDLSGATLIGMGLFNATLNRADLTGANLSDADLGETDLIGARLSGAVLSGADLGGAHLERAHLSGGVDLSHADLIDATLSSADLSGADLSYANLRDADLNEADLSGADLLGANLKYANLFAAKGLSEEQLEEARSLEGATMPNGSTHN